MTDPLNPANPRKPESEPINVQSDRRLMRIPQLKDEKRQFETAIVGQDDAVNSFSVLAARIKSGVRAGKGPIDVKFLAGPSGVGKTEIVKQLAEVLSGDPSDKNKIIRIDAQEYSHGHEVSKLVGTPPGFRGSEIPAIFSQSNIERNTIKYKDKSGQEKDLIIVLVDEAEKGAPELHKMFLGVLDEGRIQLGDNTYTDMRHAVIFYTSNVGNRDVENLRLNLPDGATDESPTYKQAARSMTIDAFQEAFPPEFRGRIQELILFNSLKPEQLEKIAGIQLHQVEEDMWESVGVDIDLQVSPQAMKWLLNQGYNPSEGARALAKVIKAHVANPLALLHTEVDLNRKSMYIDINEQADGFDFWDVPVDETRVYRIKREGQPKKAEALLPPQPVIKEQTARDLLTGYSQNTAGIGGKAPEAQKPNLDAWKQGRVEALDRGITDPLRTALRKGIKDYTRYLDWAIKNGNVTAEQIGSDVRIIEIARDRVKNPPNGFITTGQSPLGVHNEIKKLIKAGIGTMSDYQDLLDAADETYRKIYPNIHG